MALKALAFALPDILTVINIVIVKIITSFQAQYNFWNCDFSYDSYNM